MRTYEVVAPELFPRAHHPQPWPTLRSAKQRVLRIPLVAKLLGANLLIAGAAIAAAAWGRANSVELVGVALVSSFALNTYLVRLALEPLDELERVAERISRGEAYARVEKSPIADPRMERLGETLNRLLDNIGADHYRIHQLIQRSLGIRENDRAALARRLRGGTAQQLCALELLITAAQRSEKIEDARAALCTARDLSARSLEDVRSLADSIYPGLLQELGLSAALSALAVRVRNRSALVVAVDTSSATSHLSPALIRAMYHVADEAVRNVEQHAAATSVMIRLSSTTNTLRLDVTDDGKGFDAGATERSGLCVGLFQARELLANAHGSLEIHSLPGCGTRVVATARLDQGDTC